MRNGKGKEYEKVDGTLQSGSDVESDSNEDYEGPKSPTSPTNVESDSENDGEGDFGNDGEGPKSPTNVESGIEDEESEEEGRVMHANISVSQNEFLKQDKGMKAPNREKNKTTKVSPLHANGILYYFLLCIFIFTSPVCTEMCFKQ